MRAKEILVEYHYKYGIWYDTNTHTEHPVHYKTGGHESWINDNGYDGYLDAFDKGLIRIVTTYDGNTNQTNLIVGGGRSSLIKSKSLIRRLISMMQNDPRFIRNGGRVFFDVFEDGSLSTERQFVLPDHEKTTNAFIANGFK